METWVEVTYHTSIEAKEAVQDVFLMGGAFGLLIEEYAPEVPVQVEFGEWAELSRDGEPFDGVKIVTYFFLDAHTSEKLDKIKTQIEQLPTFGLSIHPNVWTTVEIQEKDWGNDWKKFFQSIPVGNHFYIMPEWERENEVPENRIPILLDIGMAFGTGAHPTTRLCLQAIERYVQKNHVVFDVGCGSGILSIAASKMNAKKVVAFDNDGYALIQAQKNVSLNQLSNIVFQQNQLLQGITDEADVIVVNIIAEVAVATLQDAAQLLPLGGYWIASAITQDKQKMVEESLKVNHFSIIEVIQLDDWVAVIAQKNPR